MTGDTPFDGETVVDLIVSAAIDPLDYPEHVTPDCRALLELMMAKDVEDRLANGDEILVALQQIARNERPMLPARAALSAPSGAETQFGAHLQFAEGSASGTGTPAEGNQIRRRVVKRRRLRR